MRRILAVLTAGAAVAAAGVLSFALPGDATVTGDRKSGTASGQRVLEAVLVGGNEVPRNGDIEGFGLAKVRVDPDGRVCWRITATDVKPIMAAHIHAGPRGVVGPIVVTLDPFRSDCAVVRGDLSRMIAKHPHQFYVNLHNAEFPEGALRGQLLH